MHRLVRRSPLFPDESLLSYITRLAHLNGYRPPASLVRLCLKGQSSTIGADLVSCPTSPSVLERFAQVTDTPVTSLVQATAHRFGAVLTPPGVPLSEFSYEDATIRLMPSRSRNRIFRPVAASQFCPLCLKDRAYHRVAWLLVSVVVCLDHLCLLMNACPYCNRPVDLTSIVENRCPTCRTDLSAAVPISIAHDEVGIAAHRLLQAWLFSSPGAGGREDMGLPDHPDQVLYHVVEGICHSLRTASPEWFYLHAVHADRTTPRFRLQRYTKGELPPDVLYCLYATSVKSIWRWPDGFYQFLQAYPSRKGSSNARHWFGQLGSFYRTWIVQNWQHPTFQFVQDAFAWYVQRHGTVATTRGLAQRRPHESQSPRVLSLLEAAHQLGTVPLVVRRLLALGHLSDAEPNPSTRQARRYVHADAVAELAHTWSIPLSIAEAGIWLGLPDRIVHRLYAAQFLADLALASAGVETMDFIPKPLVAAWLVMLLVRSSSLHPSETTIDLATIIEQTERAGFSTTSLLHAITAGQLRCYHRTPDDAPLMLQVSTADVQRWQDNFCTDTSGQISSDEVQRRLRIQRKPLQHWVDVGLLKAEVVSPGTWIFDRGTFDRFVDQHLWTIDAARAFLVHPLIVAQWVRQGRLKAVSGPGIDQNHAYLFHRTTIVRGDVALEGV